MQVIYLYANDSMDAMGKGLVRKGGLEPPWVSPPDPKSGASANSATFAHLVSFSFGLPYICFAYHVRTSRNTRPLEHPSDVEIPRHGRQPSISRLVCSGVGARS